VTLRFEEQLASVSLLACGKDPDADHITLEAFQRHLLRELRDTSYEPGFDLMNIKERPLVATVNFSSPSTQTDQLSFALADRCFAAAYFRTQNLAVNGRISAAALRRRAFARGHGRPALPRRARPRRTCRPAG
jgi:hypothetical protein